MHVPIPFLIALEFLKHHDDDRMEHLLRIGVVGVKQPLLVEVESDFYENARIKDIWTRGGIDLPEPLEEKLILLCFESLRYNLDGTDIADDFMPDVSTWFSKEFTAEKLPIVLAELRRHVTPGLVINPANCSAFLPIQLPDTKELRNG